VYYFDKNEEELLFEKNEITNIEERYDYAGDRIHYITKNGNRKTIFSREMKDDGIFCYEGYVRVIAYSFDSNIEEIMKDKLRVYVEGRREKILKRSNEFLGLLKKIEVK
jgi:hypothetical protein